MEKFVKRQNVAHYRALLESKDLDPRQREMILKLLAEEEEKGPSRPSPDSDRS